MSIVLLAVAILLLSLAGGLAPRFLQDRLPQQRLQDLTGIASGLLLTSALLVVVPEGFHVAAEAAEEASHGAPLGGGGGHGEAFIFEPVILGATILAGFVVMLLLEGLGVGHAVHEEHHDHAEGHGHGHVHHPTSPTVLAIGLTAHAAADGLAIGAAAVAGDTAFSLLITAAVVLHRVPAAFSLGLFALHETEDGGQATRGIIAFALATPLMMMLAYLMLESAADKIVALSLLFSAGTFVYVATVDTLPAIHNPESGRRLLVNVMIGVVLFTAIFLLADASGVLEHSH